MRTSAWLPPTVGGAILLCTPTIHACDSCGCHMPSSFAADTPAFSVGLFEQYTDFGTLRDEGVRQANPDGQYLHSFTTQLILGCRPAEWLQVDAFLPYIVRDYRRPDAGVEQTGSVSGIGDSTLLAQARVVNDLHADQTSTASFLLGLKIPTGSPRELSYEYAESQGVVLPGDDLDPSNATGGHDLALGSGAWDAIGGFTASYSLDGWFATGLVTYTYNTEGAYTYRFANEIAASVGVGHVIASGSPWRMWAQLNLDGDSKGHDTVADQVTSDTANHNLYLGPELTMLWRQRLTADLAVDIPIEEHNSATQLVPTWRGRASVSYQF